jgi:putative membrane protein
MKAAGVPGRGDADGQAADEVRLEPAATTRLRRLHPLTPFLRSWRQVGALSAVGLSVFRDDLDRLTWIWHALHGNFQLSLLTRAAMVTMGVAILVVSWAWLSWRATWFAIVPDPSGSATLLFHRGVLAKQRNQVRLNRVQSVDINSPLVPRLLGLAAVRLDMAAGDDASVNLAYLPRDDSSKLRAELVQRMSGARPRAVPACDARSDPSASSVASEGACPGSAHDELIAEVATEHVIKSNLLDGMSAWVGLLVWVVVLVVATIVMGWQAFVAALSGFIPVTIAIFAQLRRQLVSMMRDADFKLYRTPTGIRISSGMTSTVNRTVDFDRIQGVRLVEPFWWRRFGWARVKLDIAGGEDDFNTGASLIPVADRADALALIAAVTRADFDSPQYAGVGEEARLLDPVGWRYLAVALVENGALSRSGRWRRSTAYVPYARVQSVSARQGPVQHWLGLSTVFLDLPNGSKRWVAKHRLVEDGAALVTELAVQARRHRVSVGGVTFRGPAGRAVCSGSGSPPPPPSPEQE